MKYSAKIFEGMVAKSNLEEELCDAGMDFEDTGYDDYDNSIELYGVPAHLRLSEEAQKIIYDAGFSTVFVNHDDGWETHYNFDHRSEFKPVNGFRVSYPHKSQKDDGPILVEEKPEKWPDEWLDSGKVKIV